MVVGFCDISGAETCVACKQGTLLLLTKQLLLLTRQPTFLRKQLLPFKREQRRVPSGCAAPWDEHFPVEDEVRWPLVTAKGRGSRSYFNKLKHAAVAKDLLLSEEVDVNKDDVQ